MSDYPKYETIGGQASESVTYARLCEHLRLAAEACYTIGHLRKANGAEVTGQGWLATGQMLELIVKQVTKLAMSGGKLN